MPICISDLTTSPHTFGHTVGQFGHHDHFGQLNVAHNLSPFDRAAHGFLTGAFLFALHRCHRPLPSTFTAKTALGSMSACRTGGHRRRDLYRLCCGSSRSRSVLRGAGRGLGTVISFVRSRSRRGCKLPRGGPVLRPLCADALLRLLLPWLSLRVHALRVPWLRPRHDGDHVLRHAPFLRRHVWRLPRPRGPWQPEPAFRRRSISASEIPAGRFDGSPAAAAPPPAPAGLPAPGFGTTTRLRLVSTTTFLVRPWLKLCFTLPGRAPPRKPNVFLPSLSLI